MRHTLIVSLTLLVVVVSACGGPPEPEGAAAPILPGSDTVVSTGITEFGTVLVDNAGRSLYLFDADLQGKPSCDGVCAETWPPYLATGMPQQAGTVNALLDEALGTTRRDDGSLQVTYSSHPLYYHEPDREPGDARGAGDEQYGGGWFLVSPSGDPVRP